MAMITDPSSAASPPPPVDVARDADGLNPQDYPLRPLSSAVAGRSGRFQVIVRQSVLDDIREHGRSSPDVEVCGVLVGDVYRDQAGPYGHVEANIRGNHAPGRNAQVTFTSDTWTQIHETMDARYPTRRIIGWYHTHPGFGIFLSEMDLFIQNNFFAEPWQIAYVDDPKGGDRGVFVWHRGIAERQPYLIEPDEPAAGDRQVTANETQAATAAAAPIANGGLDLSARLRVLQRQVDRYHRRTTLLAMIAILWPLLLAALLLWSGVLPADGLRRYLPAHFLTGHPATQPADRPAQR